MIPATPGPLLGFWTTILQCFFGVLGSYDGCLYRKRIYLFFQGLLQSRVRALKTLEGFMSS